MNQKQKMQAIVESSGECWHEPKFGMSVCKHCRRTNDPRYFDFDKVNPSPTDLNELFRLANILRIGDFGVAYLLPIASEDCGVYCAGAGTYTAEATTPAEALLNAIYDSLGEVNVNNKR